MISAKGRNKRPLEDSSEFDLGDTPEKKTRYTPTPGTLRLMKDIEALENESNIVLETNREDSSRVQVEYRVDQGREMQCPNRFEVAVAKRYPHDAPSVRCLDTGFVCRFIDESGLVHHLSLTEEWTAICSLTNVVEVLQHIRNLFLNLNDPSAIETIDRSYLFDVPIPPRRGSIDDRQGRGQGEEEALEVEMEQVEENGGKVDSSEMAVVDDSQHDDGPTTLSSF